MTVNFLKNICLWRNVFLSSGKGNHSRRICNNFVSFANPSIVGVSHLLISLFFGTSVLNLNTCKMIQICFILECHWWRKLDSLLFWWDPLRFGSRSDKNLPGLFDMEKILIWYQLQLPFAQGKCKCTELVELHLRHSWLIT